MLFSKYYHNEPEIAETNLLSRLEVKEQPNMPEYWHFLVYVNSNTKEFIGQFSWKKLNGTIFIFQTFSNLKLYSLRDIFKFSCYKHKFNYSSGDWYDRKRWLLLPFFIYQTEVRVVETIFITLLKMVLFEISEN